MHISDLENKCIAIWGMGREGTTTLAFLKKNLTNKKLIIVNKDKIKCEEEFITEDDLVNHLDRIDIVIKSPGISYYHDLVNQMKKQNIKVTSATNIWFAQEKKGKVIAITGSNGKSTTSALLHHILKKIGKDVELGGNIGTPLLSLRNNANYYVVELSSYQTCDLEDAPDIAVVLNLHPEHIQWHRTHEQYYHDKCNLIRRGAHINIVNAHEPRLANTDNKTLFNERDKIHFENGTIYDGDMPVGGTEKFPLIGDHNLENLCAALTICRKLDLVITDCLKASYSYPGLPHRLQIVGPINNQTYVNDSISTDPEATIAALNALADKKITLIIGGEDRKQDYSALCNLIDTSENVTAICCYETGPRLFKTISSKRKHMAKNLKEAVELAKEITPEKGYIVLSPASPSYDAFKDFEIRGNLFLEYAGN